MTHTRILASPALQPASAERARPTERRANCTKLQGGDSVVANALATSSRVRTYTQLLAEDIAFGRAAAEPAENGTISLETVPTRPPKVVKFGPGIQERFKKCL